MEDGSTEDIDLYGKVKVNKFPVTQMLTIAEILGIDSRASKSEIKKAYHKVFISGCH